MGNVKWMPDTKGNVMQHATRNNIIPKVKVVRHSKEAVTPKRVKTSIELKLDSIVYPSVSSKRLPNIVVIAPRIGKPKPQVV